MGMTECPTASSSRERMLLQKTSDVRQQIDRMVELATVVTAMNEVGDDRAGRRRGSADSNMMQQDRAARETQLKPNSITQLRTS